MDLEVRLVPENEVELRLEETNLNSKASPPQTQTGDETDMTASLTGQPVTVTVTLAQPADMNMLMMNDGEVEEEPNNYQSSRKSAKQKRRSRKDLVYRVTCSVCQMKFTFASNLHRHMKNIHKKEEFCSECDYICSSKRQLILHMELEHKPNMVREDLKFRSIKEFYDWKLKEEVTNFACYTKRRGDIEMVSSHHEFYICYLNRRTLSMTKKQSSEMHNMHCPSKMLLKQSKRDGTVSVAYYKTHSHSLAFSSTQNLPMPDSLRYRIKEKLKSGSTVEEVESQLKTEHQTQLAVSVAYFNRLQKFDKVQITKIQKAMIKKGLLGTQGQKGIKSKAGSVQDGIQLVMDGEMGEIVNDGEVHMDIDTGQSLCGPDMIFPYDVIPLSITTAKQTPVPFISENGSQAEGKEAVSFFSNSVNNSIMSDNHLQCVQVESMPLQEPEVGEASQGEDKRIEVSPVVHDMFQQIFRLLGKDSVKEMNMHALEKSVENLLDVCKEAT